MLADFGCTQEKLATRIGRSRPQGTNTMRLLKLPTSVQSKVAAGVLSVRSVEELIVLGDVDGATRERKERRREKRSDEPEDLITEMAGRVADQLDIRVTVTGMARSNARGALVIEFADAEDLRLIVDEI